MQRLLFDSLYGAPRYVRQLVFKEVGGGFQNILGGKKHKISHAWHQHKNNLWQLRGSSDKIWPKTESEL